MWLPKALPSAPPWRVALLVAAAVVFVGLTGGWKLAQVLFPAQVVTVYDRPVMAKSPPSVVIIQVPTDTPPG